MPTIKPRRAGARWRQDAPPYVLDVLDNRGKTADRYTVLFVGEPTSDGARYIVPYLGMSSDPHSPHGISMWGCLCQSDAAAFRYRSGKDRIRWLDLPEHIRAHVVSRAQVAA